MEIEKLLENMRYCCGDMGYDDECSDHCIDPRDNRENEEEPRFCRQWLIRDAANVIEELQNQFAAVTAERDAAVEDLKRAIFDGDTNSCTFCKHENSKPESPYCLANFCDNDEWEWRGKEQTK